MMLNLTKRFLALDELSFGDYACLWRVSSDGAYLRDFYSGTIDIEFVGPDKMYIWSPEDICSSV